MQPATGAQVLVLTLLFSGGGLAGVLLPAWLAPGSFAAEAVIGVAGPAARTSVRDGLLGGRPIRISPVRDGINAWGTEMPEAPKQ